MLTEYLVFLHKKRTLTYNHARELRSVGKRRSECRVSGINRGAGEGRDELKVVSATH